MIREQLAMESLRRLAERLGFVMLGVVEAQDAPDFERFCEWLDRGYAGSMHYLPGRREAYAHPRHVLEGCRSMVVLAMPYRKHPRTLKPKTVAARTTSAAAENSPTPENLGASGAGGTESAMGRGTIAAYAAGARDYHDVIRERMTEMVASLDAMFPGTRSRGVVDTAPLLERCYGRLAGLGWVGKNTLLLNRQLGSCFFLAAILTQVPLVASAALETAHCGACRACLDACPTDAFVAPYVLDATRCISYWTIEHRGSIPEAMRAGLSDWLFGCDACQTVCPWNRKPDPAIDSALSPEDWDTKTDCLWWLTLSEEDFRRRYRRSPFWRTRLSGMRRNAMIVAANTDRRDAISAIRPYLACGDAMLEETARWSLDKLGADL